MLVDHRIGMLHLAVLIANPGQEIDALQLAAGTAALEAAGGASQPVLDRAAIHAYRDRLAVLREEIEAGNGGERARAERDWLLAELAGAAGLGGRTRAFSGNRERARIAVGKAIRRAVEHIAKADAIIGEHLNAAVRTGMQCSYRGT